MLERKERKLEKMEYLPFAKSEFQGFPCETRAASSPGWQPFKIHLLCSRDKCLCQHQQKQRGCQEQSGPGPTRVGFTPEALIVNAAMRHGESRSAAEQEQGY